MESNQAIIWAESYFQEKEIAYKGSFSTVRKMPWSCVYRIETNLGHIYLKQMACPFKIEAKLILYLATQCSLSLPKIIGYNENLMCFLMLDSGSPLRDYLKNNYDIFLPKSALTEYARIQKEVANSLEALLQLEIPDWRLQHIPSLYLSFLQKSEFLKADGLTQIELNKLKHLHSDVTHLCHKLASYQIPETIEHGDFQDNNILIKKQSIVIHDWGDAVITHPFFSLISFLKSAERNHHLKLNSPDYNEIKEVYLSQWFDYEDEKNVLQAFEVAWQLSFIKFVLSFYRIVLCPGMNDLGEYKGTIANSLREFIAQF